MSCATFPERHLIWTGLRLVGSAVGTRTETQELLHLAADGKIQPIIKVIELGDLNDDAQALEKGEITGRLVVRMPS